MPCQTEKGDSLYCQLSKRVKGTPKRLHSHLYLLLPAFERFFSALGSFFVRKNHETNAFKAKKKKNTLETDNYAIVEFNFVV